jgi:hypothetical protein
VRVCRRARGRRHGNLSADRGRAAERLRRAQLAQRVRQLQAAQIPCRHPLRSGQTLLLGGDAERFRWLSNGTEHPDTEAVLSYDSASAKSMVYYTWQDEGYIVKFGRRLLGSES